MYRLSFIASAFIHFIFVFCLVNISVSGQVIAVKNKKNTAKDLLLGKVDELSDKLMPKVIAWREDIHQHPELSNREFRTAGIVANHLRSLGIEVRTGIAKTGVVGILKGGRPGPVVALRADMDALPVFEDNNLIFRSIDSTMYNGKMSPVMHACGHDSHVAMLMGVAEILASMRNELAGTIKFIFQPSEEGPPAGEEGGAKFMVKEGVLNNPKVDVIFGQHIESGGRKGTFSYRSGSVAAENDIFKITVRGKQSHGAAPWSGVDPIVTASQIVMALQTIISRNSQLTNSAAVITVGSFHSGNRENIIPGEAVLTGTIRTLDTVMRNTIHQRMREVVTGIAASANATAEVNISMEDAMLVNDPALTEEMAPTLKLLAGNNNVNVVQAGMGAEDFAYFAQKVPGFFFQTGALPIDKKPSEVLHHTPGFMIDESSFKLGVRALCYLTINYMDKHAESK